jgi:cytochrome P450
MEQYALVARQRRWTIAGRETLALRARPRSRHEACFDADEGGLDMTGPTTVSPPIEYWRRATPPEHGFAPGPRYRTPWAWEAVFRPNPIDYLLTSYRTFGDVVCTRAVTFRSVLLVHPDHLKHVLQDNARNYVKGIVIAKLKVLIGEGLFTSEGDFWRRQRRLSQPAFHRDHLTGFATAMTETTEAMLDRWAPRARTGMPFDVAAEMSALTLGIVGRALFSRVLDADADEVGQALTAALEIVNERAIRVLVSPLWWPSATNRRLRRALAVLDRVVYDIIESRRRTGAQPGDLLSMLLLARDEETGAGMTDRQLRDEVMTFLLAGHETTAVALSWAWYLLDRHPAVAERLRAEVAAAIGTRTPTVEDLPRLRYARMVVEESMRLYPPVWGFMRQAIGEDQVGGFRIPKRAVVTISPYVTHRHPAFWEDPERFDPERFAPELVRSRPRYAYLPFSGGPRLCIGNEFALMEAQLVVAMTVQRYRLHVVPGAHVEPESRLTLRPRGGLPMAVSPVA